MPSVPEEISALQAEVATLNSEVVALSAQTAAQAAAIAMLTPEVAALEAVPPTFPKVVGFSRTTQTGNLDEVVLAAPSVSGTFRLAVTAQVDYPTGTWVYPPSFDAGGFIIPHWNRGAIGDPQQGQYNQYDIGSTNAKPIGGISISYEWVFDLDVMILGNGQIFDPRIGISVTLPAGFRLAYTVTAVLEQLA